MKKAFRSLLVFLLVYAQTGLAAGPVIWNGSRGKNLTTKGFLLSDNSIVDNDGSLTYIKNGHGEVGTTGWAAYADAAGTTPVDCTGGSPTETLTRTTSTPLVGTGSLLLTKDAANRQGEGASYAFTIDNAYKSVPISISMLTSGSANYVANDVGIYIYDVTNATLITPINVNVAANGYQLVSSFVASTSTSYRLCVHTQTTNASAYTLYLDSVFVGPAQILTGAAQQDGVSWTPTGSWSTNTTYTGIWGRSGQNMEASVKVATSGAPTSAALTINLPTGYTIDTNYLTDTGAGLGSILGVGTANDSGTSYRVQVKYSSTTAIAVSYQSNASGAESNVTQAAPFTFGASDYVDVKFSVPIVTWASNVTMANRAVEEYAYNTSTSTTASDTTSFANGIQGAQIQNITSGLSRRVRFQTPIQPTDRLVFEWSDNRVQWVEINGWQLDSSGVNYNVQAYQQINGIEYGMGRIARVVGSTTDVQVSFGRYSIADAATYGGAGSAWSAGAGAAYWRVRKVSGGAVVGYPVNTQNILGRTDGVAQGVGYIGERIVGTGSAVSIVTASYTTICSITLTAGTWDLSFNSQFAANGSIDAVFVGVATATNTNTGYVAGDNAAELSPNASGQSNPTAAVAGYEVKPTSSTTYYLTAKTHGAATTANCRFSARRAA